MFLISHRGNLNGPSPETENTEAAVEAAWEAGYHCEVDVWYTGGAFYLGHDCPTMLVSTAFLVKPKLICHAKNLAALEGLLAIGVHCFWHENDERTLTSRGFIWTYPRKHLGKRSICVQLGPIDRVVIHSPRVGVSNSDVGVAGLCSDYIAEYK